MPSHRARHHRLYPSDFGQWTVAALRNEKKAAADPGRDRRRFVGRPRTVSRVLFRCRAAFVAFALASRVANLDGGSRGLALGARRPGGRDDHFSAAPRCRGRALSSRRSAAVYPPPAGRTDRRPSPPRRRKARGLLDLARGGVCLAPAVAGRAVRSYRTFSPLPRLGSRWRGRPRRSAVCFLWHYPGPATDAACLRAARSGRWALPTTVSCRARTFLTGGPSAKCEHPPARSSRPRRLRIIRLSRPPRSREGLAFSRPAAG